MVKLFSLLGSTGSIGITSLKIIDKKKKYFKPYFFSSDKNFHLISKQVIKYKPTFFLVKDFNVFQKVKKKFKYHKTKILNKLETKQLTKKSDITISAIPGIAGLEPTLIMTKKSKKILLANKESIICGWHLINNLASRYKTKVIPIDSEHFSIFNILKGNSLKKVEKVYITASGGPFLGFNKNQLKKIKPYQALKHPKWKMGKKISVDSSTLMNKALEFIEAQKLFKIPFNKLEILIHPQSLVHAIIKFQNGLTKFIYHQTSMIIPIANAIFDNDVIIKKLIKEKEKGKFKKIENLSFNAPDYKNFPILKILHKLNEFPSTSIIVNAANEVLVETFLKHKMPFLGITALIEKILKDRNYKKYAIRNPKDLKQIIIINKWAKEATKKKIYEHYKTNF